jgi:RNA polymerase sigma factor (sigma-70 family)
MPMAMSLEQDNGPAVFRAIQEGDHHALEGLISENSRWVRGVIYAQLGDVAATDDVVQRVWLRVWERAGTLEDVRAWRGWLCGLARNMASDEIRARQRDRDGLARTAKLAAEQAVEPPRPDGESGAEERRRLVLGAIGGLPGIYREVLVLRHIEGWSYQQIADVLEVPLDTVETRLVRARRLLRESLDGKV